MSNRITSSPLQANAKLAADLEALLKKGERGPKTPAPKVPAPTPKTPRSTPKVEAAQAAASHEDGSEDEDGEGEESEAEEGSEESEKEADGTKGSNQPSEAAKNNRLRRLCEKKPSGRLQVPQEIHDIWAKGGPERMALRDQLENSGWEKDLPGLGGEFIISKECVPEWPKHVGILNFGMHILMRGLHKKTLFHVGSQKVTYSMLGLHVYLVSQRCFF